jgi:hypothetical protein
VKKYIKFRHVFKSARWIEDDAQWEITLLRLSDQLVRRRFPESFPYADLLPRNLQIGATSSSKLPGISISGVGPNYQVSRTSKVTCSIPPTGMKIMTPPTNV